MMLFVLLVSKIHKEIILLETQGYQIIMIGHEGHPEVEGTAGQLQDISKLTLVQELNDVEKLYFPSDQKISLYHSNNSYLYLILKK